ncbi:MAG: hypothetical protein JW829_19725 [Pirellulales bacterium]|nr:hypothetical protein [Pirellulales bacterium]
MGQTYAAIMGLLAMLVVVVRGIKNGAGIDGTLWAAWIGLVVFTMTGFVLGSIAESTVNESVRKEMESRLAEAELKNDNS